MFHSDGVNHGGSKLGGDAKLRLHVRLDNKVLVGIKKDISPMLLVITLHDVVWVQLQFDIRVHFACTSYKHQ